MTPPALRPDEPPAINWDEALALHRAWLRTVIASRLGEPQAVDEVLQEVALAAVRQKAPIADPTKVAPWLYRLAIRQSLMYRRRVGRARRHLSRYAEVYEPRDAASDPLQWLLADEQRSLIRAALARLARRDAEILMLKYTQSWSYNQIAQHLGLSESAVEARLHRARRKLREELAALSVIEATV